MKPPLWGLCVRQRVGHRQPAGAKHANAMPTHPRRALLGGDDGRGPGGCGTEAREAASATRPLGNWHANHSMARTGHGSFPEQPAPGGQKQMQGEGSIAKLLCPGQGSTLGQAGGGAGGGRTPLGSRSRGGGVSPPPPT